MRIVGLTTEKKITASYISPLGVGQTGFGKVGLNCEELRKQVLMRKTRKLVECMSSSSTGFCKVID